MWILSLAMGTPEWSALLAPERCQFGEEFALFLAQVTRQAHLEASIEIAVLGRIAQGRHAAPLQPAAVALQGARGAPEGLRQRDPGALFQVPPAARCAAGAPAHSEDGGEEIGETCAKQFAQVTHINPGAARYTTGPLRPIESARPPAAAFPGPVGGAQLVVLGALFTVAQHLIGLVDLLEPLLGGLVVGVFVGVVLHRQPAVGALDLFRMRDPDLKA